ncbi:hypothetical protein FEM03_22165 [Phragmitibacter flavus]|uniref:Beta-ketoacyl synthase N-terminal domain-containing protein n=1 Tax=Phragmitibacter flavus TaxID=2576071 RepID=A0A5R8K872_9BACT|nr:hypothetical protein [Phragmitibacter flavus]TLD68513.1 hypothetical protein FEM03_22165 [Phragmitibacter flavus]
MNENEQFCITGWGAVSPAGWSAASLYEAVQAGEPLPVKEQQREGGAPMVRIREVPPMPSMQDWMKFSRMRRTTMVARYSLHAAVEALGIERLARVQKGEMKVGVIFCTMNGCVQFSRKFYAEVLKEPSLASPIFFPETVYNAPSSHISALLLSTEMNYTLVGDSAQFVSAIELATQWMEDDLVDGCLVIAGEERDWLSDEALRLFGRTAVAAEGAAAVFVERAEKGIAIKKCSRTWSYGNRMSAMEATRRVREDLLVVADGLLCDGLGKAAAGLELAESSVWADWTGSRASVRKILGEGFGVTSGWQTVMACEALGSGEHSLAVVAATGLSQQAAGLVLEMV